MKYWILASALLATSAQSAIISYESSGAIYAGWDAEFASDFSMRFDYDTTAQRVINGFFTSDLMTGELVIQPNIVGHDPNYHIEPGRWDLFYSDFAVTTSSGRTYGWGAYEFWVYASADVDPFTALESGSGIVYLNAEAPDIHPQGLWIYAATFSVVPGTGEEPGAEVPEPASIALLGLGLAGLVRLRRQQLPNLV